MTTPWAPVMQSSCPGGNFPRPLLRLPVEAGNFFGIEMKTFSYLSRSRPFPTLVRQNQLVDGTKRARLTQQHGLGFLVERKLFQHFRDRYLQHGVDQRK